MKRLVRKTVLSSLEASLFVTSWCLITAYAIGDRWIEPIPRTRDKGEYV